MPTYCNIHLKVISGHELPKTDLFSQIDPYVVVKYIGTEAGEGEAGCDGGPEALGRTATLDNNPNPVWQEDFFFEAEEDEGVLHGTIVLDLYDEEVTRDEYIGSIRLALHSLSSELLQEPIELPVSYKQDKRGQKLARAAPRARIAVQVVAIGKAFSSYAAELADSGAVDSGGAIVDEHSRTVLVSVPDTDESLWAGLRFGPRSTHLLLLSTIDPKSAPNPTIWYDLWYSGAPSLRLERLQYRKPIRRLGLKVWGELRATNVPLDAKLSKVRILEREHRLVDTLDPADTLVAHNYMIGMPFLAAVKEMTMTVTGAKQRGASGGGASGGAVHVDAAAQSIWVKMDSNQPQPAQVIQLDYGAAAATAAAEVANAAAAAAGSASPAKNGGGRGEGGDAKFPVLRICSTSSDLNRGYELAFFSGGGRGSAGPMVTISEVFRRPKPILGGLYDIVHMVELCDAFVGDVLEEVGLGCYELLKPCRTWRLGKLLDAATGGELADIDEGGVGYGGSTAAEGVNSGRGDVADGGGGVGGIIRGCLSWVPCMAPPRADVYREEDGERPEKGRRQEARGSGKGRGEEAAATASKGPSDRRGKCAGASGLRQDSYRRGNGGSRSAGGGSGGAPTAEAPLPPAMSKSFRAALSGSYMAAGSGGASCRGGAAGGGGGGGGAAARGYNGGGGAAAVSVASSSDHSGGLVTYNSTKIKYEGKYGGGSSGGFAKRGTLASPPSTRSGGTTGRWSGEVDAD